MEQYWVMETRNGLKTGNLTGGFTSRTSAEDYAQARRIARDNDPVWAQYKHSGYDWVVQPYELIE